MSMRSMKSGFVAAAEVSPQISIEYFCVFSQLRGHWSTICFQLHE